MLPFRRRHHILYVQYYENQQVFFPPKGPICPVRTSLRGPNNPGMSFTFKVSLISSAAPLGFEGKKGGPGRLLLQSLASKFDPACLISLRERVKKLFSLSPLTYLWRRQRKRTFPSIFDSTYPTPASLASSRHAAILPDALFFFRFFQVASVPPSPFAPRPSAST